MLLRAIGQGVVIGLAALAVGTAHALMKPLETWNSTKPVAPAAPTPGSSHVPPANGGGTQPAPTTPSPNPASNEPAPAAPHDDRLITLARFKELMAGPLPLQIVDAREAREFSQGRIPGALNLPPGEFVGKVPDEVNQRLSRDLPTVVYCGGGSCDASKMVAMRLKGLGFAQTFVYEDGYTGWTAAGEGVEK